MYLHKYQSADFIRPYSYQSYYPRLLKPNILKIQDPQSDEVVRLLTQQHIEFQDFGGLGRGIKFWDYQVGRRHYNFHNENVDDEFYIR
jgi:hypothetical protein